MSGSVLEKCPAEDEAVKVIEVFESFLRSPKSCHQIIQSHTVTADHNFTFSSFELRIVSYRKPASLCRKFPLVDNNFFSS